MVATNSGTLTSTDATFHTSTRRLTHPYTMGSSGGIVTTTSSDATRYVQAIPVEFVPTDLPKKERFIPEEKKEPEFLPHIMCRRRR